MKITDQYTRDSIDALIQQFDTAARHHTDTYHILLFGPSPKLGVGVAGDGYAAYTKSCDNIEFQLIGDTLTTIGQDKHELISHNSVIFSSDDEDAWEGCKCGRSIVYGRISDRKVSGYDLLSNLSRQAYAICRKLQIEGTWPWRRILEYDHVAEQSREDHVHLWLTGLQFWARAADLPELPIREQQVTRFGIRQVPARPNERGESVELAMPYSIILSQGVLREPDDENIVNSLHEMLVGAQTQKILCNVFSASAISLRSLKSGRHRKKQSGAPRQYDPKKDEKLVQDWEAAKANGTSSHAEFESDRGLPRRAVREAKDRIKCRNADAKGRDYACQPPLN